MSRPSRRRRTAVLAVGLLVVLVVPAAVAPIAGAQVGPQAALSADTDLVDGQVLTVSGTGWTPSTPLSIIECDGARRLCPATYLEDVFTDATGAFTAEYRVRSNGDRNGAGALDCRVTPCFMWVADDHNEVALPLAFDPDTPPLPPPTVTISPDHDLVEGQEIAVHGSGYFPGEELAYGQCGSSDYLNPSYCQDGQVTADANGEISFTTTVVTTLYPDHGPIHYTSCHPDGCYLGIAVPLVWHMIASTLVSLVPDGDEHVEVSPATGLRDGESVSVEATGLNPGTSVDVAQCVIGDLSYRNLPFGQCAGAPVRVPVDPSGELHTTISVAERFTAQWGDPPEAFDCRVDVCQVVVGGDGVNYLAFEGAAYSWVGSPLSFADAARPVSATPAFTG